MNTASLDIIVKELAAALTGQRFGRVFQLSRSEFAIDMRLSESRYLYIDIRPSDPKAYLIRRRLKDLDKGSGNLSPFSLLLRKRLSGAFVRSIDRIPGERILRFSFEGEDETGTRHRDGLIVQLTGRSANLFLTDEHGVILDRSRETLGDGQSIGETYLPPASGPGREARNGADDNAIAAAVGSPSEALDSFYAERAAEKRFDELAAAALKRVTGELRKRQKLIDKLNADLTRHGNADEWKRLGDLLLANVSTARREGGKYIVTDYYDENVPEVAVEADENQSVTEAAEAYFRKYTKARNAVSEITGRLEKLTAEVNELEDRLQQTRDAIEQGDLSALEVPERRRVTGPRNNRTAIKENELTSAARKFRSSDGFEVLVGKKAKDNDVLTFKIAKSLDTWMHAADYPGSHVVVRNPNRVEIPQTTLLEAAQLAAFYSQGKAQVKAAVHYTQKKFVNKPKGSAPGLVSLASFKTILVSPEFPAGLEKA